jgi:DNA-binding transcriptional ArsR family regulator
MGTGSKGKPTDLFTALVHPVRRRILRMMLAEGAEMAPRELSARLGEPLSALSYHVRVLEECEAVELTGTELAHGATIHLYRCTLRTEWARAALKATEDPPRDGPRRGEEKG